MGAPEAENKLCGFGFGLGVANGGASGSRGSLSRGVEGVFFFEEVGGSC